MASRVNDMGGRLRVDGDDRRGAHVSITLPNVQP
jgi:signal transduction histidine kinase